MENTALKSGRSKKLSSVPPMNDDQLAQFWEKHDPEEFEGWEKGDLDFKRPPKKLIQGKNNLTACE